LQATASARAMEERGTTATLAPATEAGATVVVATVAVVDSDGVFHLRLVLRRRFYELG
jgi:hypothetical protein